MKEFLKQIYLTYKTKQHAPTMTFWEYYVWRMNKIYEKRRQPKTLAEYNQALYERLKDGPIL